MTKKNLIPKDLSKRKDHKKVSAKGGRSKSPSKVMQSRINGMLNSSKIPSEQKYMLQLLRERRFSDLILELISMSVKDIDDSKRRDKVIDQLSKFIPSGMFVISEEKTPIAEEYKEICLELMDIGKRYPGCHKEMLEMLKEKGRKNQ